MMSVMRNTLVWIAILILLPSGAAAADPKLAQDPRVAQAVRLAEAWLDSYRFYEDIPGISASLVHDQELVWSRGLGYADLQRKTQATPQTIYSICSISKLFTSIALMQQRDLGKLRLDDPVEKHLSWFKIQKAHSEAPPVRVEGLITHSSGLPRESDYPYWSGPDFKFPTREEMIRRVSSQATLYPAERYFQYSNLGLTLAGELVTAASGDPFDRYIRQNILDPLQMKDTSPDIPESQRGSRLATGYGRRMSGAERETVPFYQVRGIAPAAGFASTVEDLARFASWHFRLLGNGGKEVLEPNTLREMLRVHWVDPDWKTTWGLGFSVWREGEKTFVGHGGSCPGYRSQFALMPREKTAVVIMANATGVNVNLIARRIYEIVAPKIEQALKEPGKGAPPSSDLDRYTGLYRGFWGDAYVLPWEDGLALVSFPTENPMEALSKLKRSQGDTFRRVRKDGDDLGEEIVFEMGTDGRAIRLTQHSNPMNRVQ